MKLLSISFLLFMTALVGGVLFNMTAAAYEERPYRVVNTYPDNIEIRDYEPTQAAKIIIRANSRTEAANQAFGPLAGYIQGKNEASQKMAMTIPVNQQALGSNEEWVLRFFLPKQVVIPPNPDNSDIAIETLSASRMAAIRFSGRPSQQELNQYETRLKAVLDTQHLTYAKTPIYAFYNAPFTPGFLRRNEVLLTIIHQK